MRRLRLLLFCTLAACTPSLFAAEKSIEELKKEREEVLAQKKDILAQLARFRRNADAAETMAKARQALADARKAYDEEGSGSGELKKARDRELAAHAALARLVEARIAATEDGVQIARRRMERDAARRQLVFQVGLLDLQLHHRYSPARSEAQADEAVRQAAAAVAEIEGDVRDKPLREIAQTEAALAQAQAVESAAWQKLTRDRGKLAGAVEAETKAGEKMREAETEDARRKAYEDASKAYEDARKDAYCKSEAARPLLQELNGTAAEADELDSSAAVAEEILDMCRQRIRTEKGASAVKQAAGAVEAAESARDKVFQSSEIKNLQAKRADAWKACEEAMMAYATNAAVDYIALLVKEARLEAKVNELKAQLFSGKPVANALRDLVREYNEAKAMADARQRQTCESAPGYVELHARFRAAKAGLADKIAQIPRAVAAEQAVKQADQNLKKAIDRELAGTGDAGPHLRYRADIEARKEALAYRRDVAEYRIYDRNSPASVDVEGNADLAGLAARRDEIARQIRVKPLGAVVSARKEHEQAVAVRKIIEDDLRRDRRFLTATQSRQAAEKALRSARAADARGKALNEAKTAYARLLEDKLLATGSASSLVQKLQAVRDNQRKLDQDAREDAQRLDALRSSVTSGDDRDITAARKELAEAQEAVRKAEASDRTATLAKAVNEATIARDAQLTGLLSKDEGHQSLVRKLEELSRREHDINLAIGLIEGTPGKPAGREQAAKKEIKP